MVKVPQRLSNRPAPPQGKDVAGSSTDINRDIATELSVASVNPDRRGVSGHAAAVDDGVDLDAAINAALAASDVDPVTRARLDEARGAIGAVERRSRLSGFQGQNLAEALFRFVMPRLRHPDVLRAERHRAILEDLAWELAHLPDDGTVREGVVAVHRELHGLAMLRQGRNSLIEG